MKKWIRFACFSLAVVALAGVVRGNVTSATIKSGDQSTTIDIIHPGPNVPLALPTNWAFIFLPPGLRPLKASESGVVLLADNIAFYRWRGGNLEAIHPYLPFASPWVNPADGRTYFGGPTSWFVNARGDIAIYWQFHARWNENDGEHFGNVSWIKRWAPTESTARDVNVPLFTYSFPDFFWRPRFLHTAFADLKGLDDTGSVWAHEGLEIVRLSEDEQRLRTGMVRIDPANTVFPTVFQRADVFNSSFDFRGVNGAGVAIGQTTVGTTRRYFVGDKEVDFVPLQINKNGWVFGIAPGVGYILRAPDDSRELASTEVYAPWLDDQNRVNGYYYPPGQGQRNAVWLRKKDANGQPLTPAQYQRLDYLPLVPPASWTTNHQVAPGSQSLQLGVLTRTDGSAATTPFLAFPAEIAVDGNRDGEIKLSSESLTDVVTTDRPFRFWLNDDIDRIHTFRDSAATTMVDITRPSRTTLGRPRQRRTTGSRIGRTTLRTHAAT